MRKRIYLSGPIDRVPVRWAKGWREQVKDELSPWFSFCDPTEGKDLNTPGISDWVFTPRDIVNNDLFDIANSDILLVDFRPLPRWLKIWHLLTGKDQHRVGTIMEIFYAARMGIQVRVFGAERKGYWLRYYTDIFHDTLEEALCELKEEIINGELQKKG